MFEKAAGGRSLLPILATLVGLVRWKCKFRETSHGIIVHKIYYTID
jgi:hypothetical protein